MNKPSTSFTVVIKGPVASAGSILYLSSTKGTKVPKSAAKIITAIRDILTVKDIELGYPISEVMIMISPEQIIPFNKATPNSFMSR